MKSRLWETLGKACLAADRTDTAVESFRRAVQLWPQTVSARRAILRQTDVIGKTEAEELINQLHAIEGEDGLTLLGRTAEEHLDLARLLDVDTVPATGERS